MENEECVQLQNHGYTDWHMPNVKELYSTTYWEGEFASYYLESQGFTDLVLSEPNSYNPHWTSTTDPANTNNSFRVRLDVAQGLIISCAKDNSDCVSRKKALYVWPVRNAVTCSNLTVIIESQSFQSDSLQEAYDTANNGVIIKSQDASFIEDLLEIDTAKTVYLRAGYDCDYYEPPSGSTNISGDVIISYGTLIIEAGIVTVF